jgi:hypothetical protein
LSYSPTTDFLALLRTTAAGVTNARVPGLDYVVAAMARAGMFSLSVGQTAPIVNQAITVWLKPALPSWTAEGTVFLWNPAVGAYQVATAPLWINFFGSAGSSFQSAGYSFQSATLALNIVSVGTSLLAVQRAAPFLTTIVLPKLTDQFLAGRRLRIVDWSTNVVNHVITVTTPDSTSIMKLASWSLLSTPDQLAGTELMPSPDLNGWTIAP